MGSTPVGPLGKARLLSPAQIQQLSDLQALFKPGASLQRIDDFSKWIFASTTIVGTLGAAFSNTAFHALVGVGRVFFAVAVLLIGLSLSLATVALVPRWGYANPASMESMLTAVDQNIKARKRPLQVATACFALALALAGTAPFASLLPPYGQGSRPQVALTYELSSEGKLTGRLTADGLNRLVPVELSLGAGTPVTPLLFPKTRTVADQNGHATASIELSDVKKLACGVQLKASWADSSEPGGILVHDEQLAISTPVLPSPSKSEKPAGH
jgi:hypothetical protein